jgi:16S rRNA (cytosine967-C5)-methyltransferase
MPISPARTAAFEILLRVQQENSYASELLHSSQYHQLSPADHRLATELVMGVLRWRSCLDNKISPLSALPIRKLDLEVLTSLRLAAYQLLFLDRIPQSAAVNQSVELVKQAKKRSAVAFVNAVLRKFPQASAQVPLITNASASDIAAAFAHPEWLVDRWIREFGLETAQQICTHDQRVPGTTIHFCDPTIEQELKENGIELASSLLLASARRVVSGDITQTPAFREGRLLIQDEASQLVSLLVGKGKHILDGCAAPGGKTRMIAERNPSATILAAELHPRRAQLLRRLAREKNIQIVAADARHLPTSMLFDRVLVDVPCSGTGTLARNPEIKWRLRPADIADLQVRQLAILQSVMQHLEPGGRLIYSTCSLEREENAEVVEKALTGDRSLRALNCSDILKELRAEGELVWRDLGSLTHGPYLRTIPGRHPCDGFFAGIIEKR